MTDHTMTCERADALLPDWFEQTLDERQLLAMDAHVAGCPRCAAIVADLNHIVADAAALPTLAPSRDLWSGIAARIETPVVALGEARALRAPNVRPRYWRTAAAAVVLVGLTAGITWRLATNAAQRTPLVAQVAPVAPDSGPRIAAAPVDDTGRTAPADVEPARGETRDTDAPRTAPRAPSTPRRPLARTDARLVAGERAPKAGPTEAMDNEIAAMREILAKRRGRIDPSTAAVLERNLRVIDQAIAESRAALAQDPNSGFLTEQLTRTLRRKLDLLRTAAELPARST